MDIKGGSDARRTESPFLRASTRNGFANKDQEDKRSKNVLNNIKKIGAYS